MSSSSSKTPVIVEQDIRFYLSGGYFNDDPNESLGGEMSSFALLSGSLHGLFDRIDTTEAEIGDIEYRCFYIRNTNQTRKLLGTKIWIETGTPSPKTSIGISIGSSGINGTEPRIPTEDIEPPMNFFEVPLQAPEEPNIGDLFPGDHIGLWVRWYVAPGTESISDDIAIIRIDGEREPESLTSPLPDPSDPPAQQCGTGEHWDPVSKQCVPDSVAIVCPNGYVYNESTQRCVPSVTPPPSVPLFKFAVNGDFACGTSNTQTIDLIKSKLNTANGPDQSLFIANGDFSYVDGNQTCWINSTKVLGDMYPSQIAPTIGNHDDTEDGAASDRTAIINTYPLIPSVGYYALTRRNIRFIFMDTQRTYAAGSAQHAFVVSTLNAAKADPAIKWIIVSYHKPSLVSDGHHASLTDLRNLYHPLFEGTGKVAMVNSGHNHVYFRSKPLKFNPANPGTPTIVSTQANGNYINIDGIIYVTTGTGGRRSNHTFDASPEPYVGYRSLPPPYGTTFVTLQDNGNQLSFEYITNSGQVTDSYQVSKPGASTPAPLTCPTGYTWSEAQGRCITAPTSCPAGQHFDIAQNKCVPDIIVTPPPTSEGYPMTNVQWYYDSSSTLAVNQTISSGNTDAQQQIILCASASGVNSVSITGGYLLVKSGGGNGRIYLEYYKKNEVKAYQAAGATQYQSYKNLAMTFLWVYEGQDNCSVKDGNHNTAGFPGTGVLCTPLEFGGFGFSLHQSEIQSKVEYYHNVQGNEVSSVYPGNRKLVSGKSYRVFATWRTDRAGQKVVFNCWMDFGDGSNWVKIMTDRAWGSSGWSPGSVPNSCDKADILAGPWNIKRHHVWIRNNGGGADMKIKDIKLGTLPYIS